MIICLATHHCCKASMKVTTLLSTVAKHCQDLLLLPQGLRHLSKSGSLPMYCEVAAA